MAIKNKREWYKIFNQKIFNQTHNFTFVEFRRQHWNYDNDKMFCFRNTKKIGAPFVCMKKHDLLLNMYKYNESEYIISEKAPDENIIVQGHFDGFDAEVSFEKKTLRECYKKGLKKITRCQLMGIVGYERYRYLCGLIHDFSNSLDLKERPVIEFSVYDKPVGVYNNNMIIWEIRNY